jgi:hypothetical protein
MPRAYVHSSQEHTCSRLRTMYAAMDMSHIQIYISFSDGTSVV